MALSCPKCNSPFEQVTFQDITVDRCTSCHGLWFDLMEHRHLRKLAGSEAIDTGDPKRGTASNRQTKIDCPKCKSPMSHMRDTDRRDIEYEYCSVCNGLFFDAGEFARYKETSFLGSLRSMFGK
jgi:Zn-finger nucleic acid-binding protein